MITPSPSSFNKPIYTPTDTSMEQVILEPYEYLKRMPGNDFPSLLVQAFNQWLKIPNDKLRTITEILTMMNTSALM
ncbi:Geranylgeranyl pyrophosphate synthase [Spiromyces aspiralis]|uniref:Geranylgeranyl pyrophosphate synthase n=1 Tax=Spiromyces aspiralis TaxID=68401 RepID=A0ACC1HG07_9FUNG|nr:Geranylgeranyl pyrophosphate synthase [Spiromyces aspiralis]